MQRGFKYLIDAHSEAGAREIFEKICVQICQSLYGAEAKSVRLTQGDGGLDVLVGELPNPQIIYQCKFFPDKIGSSQKQQITESFMTATNNYSPKEWCLCLPLILSKEELLWWSKWKADHTKTNLKINIFDGSYLINKLKEYGLYHEIFDDDIRNSLQKILEYMSEYKNNVLSEVIYGYDDVDSIVGDYQEFIFVKMLESANITNTDACIVDFYNAEIAKHTSLSKNEVQGLKIYNNLKSKIYSLWITQYRIDCHPKDGNALLGRVYQRIEESDTNTLKTSAEYSLIAKNGILHQLADDKKIGWIDDYLTKLSEYMETQS